MQNEVTASRRKPRRTSPTQRSLAVLRKAGYIAQVVEHWNPHAHVRQDLFGIGDILAVDHGEILLVQTTTAVNMAARRAKVRASPLLEAWLDAGGKFVLHGWALRGARGRRKTWQLIQEVLT